MLARQIDEVRYDLKIQADTEEYTVAEGGGQLYLSDEALLINDDSEWYDIPLDKIVNIERKKTNGLIRFILDGMTVSVSNEKGTRILSALRHYLLPFISEKRMC